LSTLGLLVSISETRPNFSQIDNAATKSGLSKLASRGVSATTSFNTSSSKDSGTSASASAINDGDYYVNKALFLGMRFLIQAMPEKQLAKMVEAIAEKGGEVVAERKAGVWTIMPFAK
jgi:hypothetical protein